MTSIEIRSRHWQLADPNAGFIQESSLGPNVYLSRSRQCRCPHATDAWDSSRTTEPQRVVDKSVASLVSLALRPPQWAKKS